VLAVPARAVCFWALMRRAAAARQVIAGICLAVWLINIPRFNDPLHGGWVRSWPAACRLLCICVRLARCTDKLAADVRSAGYAWHCSGIAPCLPHR